MNTFTKIKAKELLYRNTLRLFAVSLISVILRWSMWVTAILLPPVIINSPVFDFLKNELGISGAYTVTGVCCFLWTFFTLCFSGGVHMGEQWVYLQRLHGVKARLRFLFKFLSPKKSIRAVTLYCRIILLKLWWTVYFIMPAIICFLCSYYLSSSTSSNMVIILIPAVGGAVLSAVALVLIKATFARYCIAPFFMSTHPDTSATDALQYSIKTTDPYLYDYVLLRFSLAGWVAGSILPPLPIYTVPYLKMCNVVFMAESMYPKVQSQSTYAISFLSTAQHIHKCG